MPFVTEDLLTIKLVSKQYGQVKALTKCSIEVRPGEILGLIGHNGAGKSTIVNLLLGLVERDSGSITLAGVDLPPNFEPKTAFDMGIRCVFQELSLCANLDAAENTLLVNASLEGPGWRKRAKKAIREGIQAVFPGSDINLDSPIGELSLAQRQMIEIGRAFVDAGERPKIIILDEPTSSLDAYTAAQLMDHIKHVRKNGQSVILISHKLAEVAKTADRIVVMRDGSVAAIRHQGEFDESDVFKLMGGDNLLPNKDSDSVKRLAAAPRILSVATKRIDAKADPFFVREGEIVGLAGLEGHGQREMLLSIYKNRERLGRDKTPASMSYTSGDRQREGVFSLWSIARNISIGSLASLGRLKIPAQQETKLAQEWFQDMKVRAASPDAPILSLSGGNQQKVLLARAFASGSQVMLLDDPTRGVDLGTKRELYARIREAAKNENKSVVWYSTESEELIQCDRVYVMNSGHITAEFTAEEFDTKAVVKASFIAQKEVEALQ